MVEGQAQEVPEERFCEAVQFAHEQVGINQLNLPLVIHQTPGLLVYLLQCIYMYVHYLILRCIIHVHMYTMDMLCYIHVHVHTIPLLFSRRSHC